MRKIPFAGIELTSQRVRGLRGTSELPGRPVCVCVFSSHSFWTSSSLDVPAGVTQEEGHTEFLIHLLSAVRALIFLARRIQPFLSLVDREVEFCVLTILIVLHPLCVCVCFLPIHSGHQVRWTYQPGSHRRKVAQDFSSTFFLRCMP